MPTRAKMKRTAVTPRRAAGTVETVSMALSALFMPSFYHSCHHSTAWATGRVDMHTVYGIDFSLDPETIARSIRVS